MFLNILNISKTNTSTKNKNRKQKLIPNENKNNHKNNNTNKDKHKNKNNNKSKHTSSHCLLTKIRYESLHIHGLIYLIIVYARAGDRNGREDLGWVYNLHLVFISIHV